MAVDGRVVAASSNLGDQAYTYDELGRLTKVQDDRDATAGCVTRAYTFSTSSERTGKTTYGPDAGGSCQTTTADTTWTGAYNAANQVTNAGYTYDNLGRTRTTPAADGPPPSSPRGHSRGSSSGTIPIPWESR